MDSSSYYEEILYPFQDKILKSIDTLQTPFYLTGGTALSRFYYQHRYSDDLDFFVNASDDFSGLKIRLLKGFKDFDYTKDIESDDFLRILFNVPASTEPFRVDFVNDIPFYFGEPRTFELFSRVDNVMNILSNKLTCLDRFEPKDVVDIIFIWKNNKIDWKTMFTAACSKAAGIYPPKIAELLQTFPEESLSLIRFIKKYPLDSFREDREKIIQEIISPTK